MTDLAIIAIVALIVCVAIVAIIFGRPIRVTKDSKGVSISIDNKR